MKQTNLMKCLKVILYLDFRGFPWSLPVGLSTWILHIWPWCDTHAGCWHGSMSEEVWGRDNLSLHVFLLPDEDWQNVLPRNGVSLRRSCFAPLESPNCVWWTQLPKWVWLLRLALSLSWLIIVLVVTGRYHNCSATSEVDWTGPLYGRSMPAAALKIISGHSEEECKLSCLQEKNFKCISVNYELTQGLCSMLTYNRFVSRHMLL